MRSYLYIFLAGFVAVSCSYNTVDGNTAQSIQMAVNQKFRINLPEDHSSGYTWQLNDSYDATIADHTNTVWEGKTKGVFFYFIAKKTGKTVLNFTSRKYDDINAIKEITLNVTEK